MADSPFGTQGSLQNSQSPQSFSSEKVDEISDQKKQEKTIKGTPSLILSKEEKSAYLEKRKNTPLWIQFLKYTTLFIFFTSIILFIALVFDLDTENRYLRVYGLEKNTLQRYDSLKKEHERLKEESALYTQKINETQQKIEKQEYSPYSKIIHQLKTQQLSFFDTKDTVSPILNDLSSTAENQLELLLASKAYIPKTSIDEIIKIRNTWSTDPANQNLPFPEEKMKELLLKAGLTEEQYGLLEAPFHVAAYLMSPEFEDLILTSDNRLTIKNISINRSKLSFNIEGSNMFGNTFLLHTKFVEFMNAFPFLDNGSISVFDKQFDENEDSIMEYTAEFDIIRLDNSNMDLKEPNLINEKESDLFTRFKTWEKNKKTLDTKTQSPLRIF